MVLFRCAQNLWPVLLKKASAMSPALSSFSRRFFLFPPDGFLFPLPPPSRRRRFPSALFPDPGGHEPGGAAREAGGAARASGDHVEGGGVSLLRFFFFFFFFFSFFFFFFRVGRSLSRKVGVFWKKTGKTLAGLLPFLVPPSSFVFSPFSLFPGLVLEKPRRAGHFGFGR